MSEALRVRTGVPEPLRQAAAQLVASRRAKNTQIAYTQDWAKWEAFVAQTGLDAYEPTLMGTTLFRDELQKAQSPASMSRILGTLSFFYRAFMDAGLVRSNPFARALLPRPIVGHVGKTALVAEEDAKRILQLTEAGRTSADLRDGAVLRLLYDTGLRRMSVAELRRADIDFARQSARVLVKGGREERVALTSECAYALTCWLAIAPPSEYVFPGRSNDGRDVPMNVNTVNKIVSERAAAAGVHGLHPHCFRTTFLTAAYDLGINERDIQAAAHHADASTTRRYDRGQRGEGVVAKVAEARRKRA